jgi:ParB family chromosome partitioning protein
MAEDRRLSQKWKLARLKGHPQQAAMFGDVSDEELQALAEDMRAHGQRDPVEVLPDGTVLTGHQRIRAARLLGWAVITVVVRHDLAEAGPAAQEQHLINDNLLRRHLSPLGRARSIRRLLEIEAGRRPGGLTGRKKEALKDELGKRLTLSLRSVNRYLLVLDSPPEVQAAFDRGEITLIQAGRVALLRKAEQQEVATRLRAGERAAPVVAEALARARGEADDAGGGRAFRRFVGALQRETPLLQGQTVSPARLKKHLPLFRTVGDLLAEMIERAVREAS